MPQIPAGVVSADAIEHLDPLVVEEPTVNPDGSVEYPVRIVSDDASDQLLKRLGGSKIGVPRRSGLLQSLLTMLPIAVIDLASISGGILFSVAVLSLFGVYPHSGLPMQGMAVLIAHLVVGRYLGIFPATAMSPVLELRQLVRSATLSFALVIMLNSLFAVLSMNEVIIGLTSATVSVLILPLARAVGRYRLGRTSWWGERAIIIGSGAQGRALYDFFRRSPGRGLRVLGLIDTDGIASDASRSVRWDMPSFPEHRSKRNDDSQRKLSPRIGSVQDISGIVDRYDIRWGIVAPGGCQDLGMDEVLKFSGQIRNLIMLPSNFLMPSLWTSSRECGGVLGVHLTDQLRSPLSRGVKKCIDLFVAGTALIALLPLMTLFVAMIKWRSPGPAFYGHTRIGKGGKKFKAWKLRTMVPNADEVLEEYLESDPEARQQWIEDQKLKSDPRIIPAVGNFLRKTSLDELPQLFNVLCGDMSIVGPRPIVQNEVSRYGEMYAQYLRVRPGITGLWQVSGRNDTSYSQRVRLDSYYVSNWSVWMDAYIMVRTLRTLLLREGAY